MKIGGKLCNFISLYRSPSHTQDKLEQISENLERNLVRCFQNNPFLFAGISYFNVKSSSWYYHGKTSSKGYAVDTMTKKMDFTRSLSNQHILDNSSASIDYIFTLQPN